MGMGGGRDGRRKALQRGQRVRTKRRPEWCSDTNWAARITGLLSETQKEGSRFESKTELRCLERFRSKVRADVQEERGALPLKVRMGAQQSRDESRGLGIICLEMKVETLEMGELDRGENRSRDEVRGGPGEQPRLEVGRRGRASGRRRAGRRPSEHRAQEPMSEGLSGRGEQSTGSDTAEMEEDNRSQ